MGRRRIKINIKIFSIIVHPSWVAHPLLHFPPNKSRGWIEYLRFNGEINVRPWDTVFRKKEPYYVKIYLKNGMTIAGIYDRNSYASRYPNPEQIYLEAVVDLDEHGYPEELPIDGSKGILISGKEIFSIEFLERYVED